MHQHQRRGRAHAGEGRLLQGTVGDLDRIKGEGGGYLAVTLNNSPRHAATLPDRFRQSGEGGPVQAFHDELYARLPLPGPGPEHMLNRQGDGGKAGI